MDLLDMGIPPPRLLLKRAFASAIVVDRPVAENHKNRMGELFVGNKRRFDGPTANE